MELLETQMGVSFISSSHRTKASSRFMALRRLLLN